MPSHSIRIQLFGLALLLVGGLWNVQRNVVDAYSTSGLATALVLVGVLAVTLGLLAPLIDSDGTDGDGAYDDRAASTETDR